MSIRESIKAADDCGLEKVDVKEWKTTVYISTMNGHNRLAWNELAFDDDGNMIIADMYARLLVFCLTDENGKRLYGNSPEDIAELSAKNAKVLFRLFSKSRKMNLLDEESKADAEKN